MNVIDVDIDDVGSNLNVPILRQSKFKAFLSILISPIKWLNGNVTNDYINASNTYSQWSNATTYSIGNRVIFGISLYEYINDTPSAGNVPTNSSYWYLVCSDNIGLNERLNYNAEKLQLEYALNRRFSPLTITPPFNSGNNSIYITTNQGYPNILWVGKGNGSSKWVAPNTSNRFYYCPTEAGVQAALNTTNYTIYIPLATLNGLGPTVTDGINMIKKEASKYSLAGITFDVQHY